MFCICLFIGIITDLVSSEFTVSRISRRIRRQIPREIEQGCKTTGYETRLRELCEEVLETVCKPVKEVEYRKEIQERCDTRLQQQCNTTIRERPREVCKERSKLQCFTNIKLVVETSYEHECENIVQHVCEELYHVPHAIHHHVTPRPIFAPGPVPVAVQTSSRTPRSPLWLRVESMVQPRVQFREPQNPHVQFQQPQNPRVQFQQPHMPKPNETHGQYIRHRPSVPPRYRRSPQDEKDKNLVLELNNLNNAVKAPSPTLISHKELPAPPGCRTVVTQSCRKVPVEFKRKVPDEECEEVPDITCHLELEKYEEPVCKMVPVKECEELYKEIPFLVDDEECEDIPRLQCTEVEEEVPIQVCTSIDIQRDVIISNRGRTFTTQTKNPGATVVGALPDDDDEEEEDRSRRRGVVQIFELDRSGKSLNLEEEDENVEGIKDDNYESKMSGRSKDTKESKAKKVVKLLKKLLLE